MRLVDTHCHIQSIGRRSKDDHTAEMWQQSGLSSDKVIDNANSAGVDKLICVGCDIEDSLGAVEFVAGTDHCYAAIGIHPHEAKRYLGLDARANLLKLTKRAKVVAIGECGLDYFYDHSKREDQSQVLRMQLDIAAESGLPVIFHVRQAFKDFWPIFDSYGGKLKGVLHSFTDSSETLSSALERGLFIGVNGIATFAKDPKQLDMYQAIPSDRLLLETDAPYLTPTPYRGTVNEPKHILTVANFLAKLRGEDLSDIAETSTSNANLLFGL